MEDTGILKVTAINGVDMYDHSRATVTGHLDYNTDWAYNFLEAQDALGRYWFRLGADNQWVSEEGISTKIASVAKVNGTVKISKTNVTVHYSLNGSVNKRLNPNYLAPGEYQYFERAYDSWNNLWYNLGSAQWVMAADVDNGNRRQEFLDYAKQVGTNKTYALGAKGPNSFDCSGLVYYALQHFGISIGYPSGNQYFNTVPINQGEAQPGDLIFFGVNGSSHVGIVNGDGRMFSAMSESSNPNIGYSVPTSSSPYYWPTPISYRRISQLN